MTGPSPLRLARLARGMTQDDVGEIVGVTGATIGRVELGLAPMNPDVMAVWLDALGLEGSERRRVALSVIPAAYCTEVAGE